MVVVLMEVVRKQSCSHEREDKKRKQRRGETKRRGRGGGGRRREYNVTLTKTRIVTATNLVAMYNETQDTRQQDNHKEQKSLKEKWKMGIPLDGTCRA
jgi:hypothetical protein